jgi:hypothetical protein
MLKSEATRVIKNIVEETGAQFTDEQIEAITQMFLRITQTTVDESLANFRPSSSGGRGPY